MFVCYCTIEPGHRDKTLKQLLERGTGGPSGVKLLGAWMSLPQQETWAIFQADDAAEIMRFWHPWTGLNVNKLTPVMDFKDLTKLLADEY